MCPAPAPKNIKYVAAKKRRCRNGFSNKLHWMNECEMPSHRADSSSATKISVLRLTNSSPIYTYSSYYYYRSESIQLAHLFQVSSLAAIRSLRWTILIFAIGSTNEQWTPFSSRSEKKKSTAAHLLWKWIMMQKNQIAPFVNCGFER